MESCFGKQAKVCGAPGVITRSEESPWNEKALPRAVWRVSGGDAVAHAASCFVYVLTCTDVLMNRNYPFIRHHQPISQEQEREFSRIPCRIPCCGFSVAFSVCQCLRASLLAARRSYHCRRCQDTEETLLFFKNYY